MAGIDTEKHCRSTFHHLITEMLFRQS